jgi:two-component system sensor histidine kinase BaeS
MRRKLLIAIVGMVITTVVVAGLGTAALAQLGARRYAEAELRDQAAALAASLPAQGDGQTSRRIVRALRVSLRLTDADVVAIGSAGRVIGALPAGLIARDLAVARLRAGETVSGHHGDLVYAASVLQRGPAATNVVVLTQRSGVDLGVAVPWFVLAAAGAIGLGSVVAVRVSRTLTEPLRQADEASRRIAAGDLAARVPEPDPSATDEVADLSRSVNAMAAALERSRGLERQFLLSVSHDLRTPLTSIQGYAEAIADGTAPDHARAAGVILSESRRLERLVRDLLELGRLDARQFSFDLTDVEARDLVEACIDGFRPEAQAGGITMSVSGAEAVVRADRDRAAQVVANLLDNALRFARTQVVATVEVRGPVVRLTIDDDGPGIAADDLPHVFERLYVSHHQPEGTESSSGLGLAIVRELVVAMDGQVGAEPGSLGGASLWFELPAVQ